MRLDRFLWWTRLARTRSAAQALAERGSLRIDGRRIERAHCPVRIGDTLTFAAPSADGRGRVRVVRVLALPTRRGPAPEAQACYAEPAADGVAAGSENVSQEGAEY